MLVAHDRWVDVYTVGDGTDVRIATVHPLGGLREVRESREGPLLVTEDRVHVLGRRLALGRPEHPEPCGRARSRAARPRADRELLGGSCEDTWLTRAQRVSGLWMVIDDGVATFYRERRLDHAYPEVIGATALEAATQA